MEITIAIMVLALLVVSPLWDRYWVKVITYGFLLMVWGIAELVAPFVIWDMFTEGQTYSAIIYAFLHIALFCAWLALARNCLKWLKNRPLKDTI